jgi:hypothetical protein
MSYNFERKIKKLPPKEAQRLIYKRLMRIFMADSVKSDILNNYENYSELWNRVYPLYRDSYYILKIMVLMNFADYEPSELDLNFEIRALNFARRVFLIRQKPLKRFYYRFIVRV